MAAKDALEAYGFKLDDDGKYRRYRPDGSPIRTQVWQETPDGWLRFDNEGAFEVPMAYMVGLGYRGVSGLDMKKQPEAFIWIYPEDEVERIYSAAVEAESARLAEVLKRKAAEAKG